MTTLTNEAINLHDAGVLQRRFAASLAAYGLNGGNYVADASKAEATLSPEVLAVLSDPQYNEQSRASRDGIEVSLSDMPEQDDAYDDGEDSPWSADDFFAKAEQDESIGRQRLVECHLFDVRKLSHWKGKQAYDGTGAPVGTRFRPKAFAAHEGRVTRARRYYSIPEAFDKAGRVRAGFLPLVLTAAPKREAKERKQKAQAKVSARAQLRALAKARKAKA